LLMMQMDYFQIQMFHWMFFIPLSLILLISHYLYLQSIQVRQNMHVLMNIMELVAIIRVFAIIIKEFVIKDGREQEIVLVMRVGLFLIVINVHQIILDLIALFVFVIQWVLSIVMMDCWEMDLVFVRMNMKELFVIVIVQNMIAREKNITSTNITIGNVNDTIIYSLEVENSSVLLNGNIIILGDISILDSFLTFSNSSIIVAGCVYLKNNTQITIDLSKYQIENDNKITLIKSNTSCLNVGSITYVYSNEPKGCDTFTPETDIDSISLLVKVKACEFSNENILKYNLFFLIITNFLLLIQWRKICKIS